jgi:hypothetical protein
MPDTRALTPLSRTELVVLGCLAQSAPPDDAEIGDAVRELWLREDLPERAHRAAMEALAQLREHGFVDPHRKLTDDGALALRSACGLKRRPAWSTFRQRLFPALVLGAPVAPVPKKGKGPDQLARHLASRLGVSQASSLNELCDALLADELKMVPGAMTLARIRAHILALRAHRASRALRDDVAPRPVAGPPDAASEPTDEVGVEPVQRPSDLLTFVRETLPQIGDDGRYGSEKVFVSALWQRLERRGRPAELSLDHFKRWLVTANRNRWLTLARADVVGAMDPKQVRESEIQDLGATFHFVLDPARNPSAQQGRTHVR